MIRTLTLSLALCALVALTNVASAQEGGAMVDNPQYQNWKQFGVGTQAVYHMNNDMGPMKMQMEMTQTLKSIDSEKAVIAMQNKMFFNGQEQVMPVPDQDIPAKITQAKYDETEGNMKEVGQESQTVAGQTIACTKYTIEQEQGPGQKMNGTLWASMQIPGRMVRMEADVTSPQGNGKMTMTLKSYTAK